MSVIDIVQGFSLCDKPRARRGGGAPVLQFIPVRTVPPCATLSSWMPVTLCGNTSAEQVAGRCDREKQRKT